MLKVKVADNAYLREKGLMFETYLPKDEGMLFVFNRPQHLTFWGKNTFIPLDIAFIDKNNTIIKISQIKKLDLTSVSSESPCSFAIETNINWFKENNINVGDKIILENSPTIGGTVLFNEKIIKFTKNEKIKDIKAKIAKYLKESQLDEKIKPIDNSAVGEPIKNQELSDLPTVDMNDINSVLEDTFDETQNLQEDPSSDVTQSPQENIEQPLEQENVEDEKSKSYPVFRSAFEASEWAENESEVIRISYTTKHGRSLIRDVEPHGKFHSKSTMRDILVTWDETVGDIRAFIVSNISKWAFIGKKFDKKFIVKL